jgi:hypothetical protein
MNNDEARFLLGARRPNGADDQDPAMQAALVQAARDPALGAWLAREQTLDAFVSRRLGAITPPADLRAQLIAGASLQTRPDSARSWWRSSWWMVMAACLAVVVTLGALGLLPSSGAPELQSLKAVAFKEASEHHSNYVVADQLGDFGRWLQTPGQTLLAGLPIGFDELRAQGCRRLKIGGREVLEVCFWRDNREYHLYVARRADFPDVGEAAIRRTKGSVVAAAWADDAHVYVLATQEGPSAFAGVL